MFKKLEYRSILKYLFFPLAIALYVFLLFRPIDFTREDLGRHLMNGKLILNGQYEVLYKNVYSYTRPETDFVNHHWLTGVVFYLIFNTFNINVLMLFQILISVISFTFFFKTLEKKGSIYTAIILAIPAMITFTSRSIARPESFGLLFINITVFFIYKIIKEKRISNKIFVYLLFQQLLWINLHISFIFSLFLIALLLFSIFLKSPQLPNKVRRKIIILFLSSILISLLNPNTYKGLLQPFTIFSDYGYRVVENQNLWFLFKIMPQEFIYFYVFFTIINLIFLSIYFKKVNIFDKLLTTTAMILGFIALRNAPIYVAFSFPFLSWAIHQTFLNLKNKVKISNLKTNLLIVLGFYYIANFIILISGIYSPLYTVASTKIGYEDQQFEAVKFFKKHNLKGNIFNNYDNGSFLVYNFYPEYKVFVDNRPEAFDKIFFQEYIAMQENPQIWQQALEKYNFQTIFFSINDLTPWGQQFLYDRSQDEQWEQAYLDKYSIIFTKKSNKPVSK